MLWDDYRKALLALVCWREAGNQPREGQRAVMHVIRNRVNGNWGTWEHVICSPNQFSSMTIKGDSNLLRWPKSPDAAFDQILQLVDGIWDGSDEDITNGALYYYNPEIATSEWFTTNIAQNTAEHPQVAQIGAHVFFA